MIVNPDKCLVVRIDPIDPNRVTCDQLDKNLKYKKELCSFEGTDIHRAFADFANRGHIVPIGWYETDEFTYNTKNYYYANVS